MAVDTGANLLPVFDLKSASLTLVALVLKTTDLGVLAEELEHRFGDAPDLFDGDPVVLDLSLVADAADPIDFAALAALLRARRLQPIAVKGGCTSQHEAARDAGLVEAPDTPVPRPAEPPPPRPAAPSAPAASTLIVDKPLRSGQQVYARGGDLIVLALVSYGAEVIADGSIHVYAPLRGRALAGAKGNTDARIYTTCMQAQLLSIAGTYRTGEAAVPSSLDARPAMARLDGDTLLVEPLSG